MKRVSELTSEPEVGKYYLVPVVVNLSGYACPVLGPEHEDREYIGVARNHYHYDLRFVADALIEHFCGHMLRTRPITCDPVELMMIFIHFTDIVKGKPAERKMKCRRRMPKFPLEVGAQEALWMKPLEDAYANTKLNCARCPHRGMPLSKDNADENGVVVCPGHGLAFNINTGKLVSRLAR